MTKIRNVNTTNNQNQYKSLHQAPYIYCNNITL